MTGDERGEQIGAVADRLGLSVRTLHHWEEAGLLRPSHRSRGGFRLYSADDVERALLIRRMKPLGFTLEEMRRLLEAVAALNGPASDPATDEARDFVADCLRRAADGRADLLTKAAWAEELEAQLRERLAVDEARG